MSSASRSAAARSRCRPCRWISSRAGVAHRYEKAQSRHKDTLRGGEDRSQRPASEPALREDMARAALEQPARERPIDLRSAFARAADEGRGGEGDDGDDGGIILSRARRRGERDRVRARDDFERER